MIKFLYREYPVTQSRNYYINSKVLDLVKVAALMDLCMQSNYLLSMQIIYL